MNKFTIRKTRYKIENNILENKYSYPTQKDKAHRVCLKLLSIEQKIGIAIIYEKEIKEYLKSKLLSEYQKKDTDKTKLSFRDLEKLTGLNSKQLQRIIHEDKYPHFDSSIKACQGLLDNTSKLTKSKKSKESANYSLTDSKQEASLYLPRSSSPCVVRSRQQRQLRPKGGKIWKKKQFK